MRCQTYYAFVEHEKIDVRIVITTVHLDSLEVITLLTKFGRAGQNEIKQPRTCSEVGLIAFCLLTF